MISASNCGFINCYEVGKNFEVVTLVDSFYCQKRCLGVSSLTVSTDLQFLVFAARVFDNMPKRMLQESAAQAAAPGGQSTVGSPGAGATINSSSAFESLSFGGGGGTGSRFNERIELFQVQLSQPTSIKG